MPTETTKASKPVRLFKAVRELNVSVESIVQTLQEGGFELDDKLAKGDINAKLPPEMYEALRDVFAEDMDARARVSALRARREREERIAQGVPDEPAGDSVPTRVEPPVAEEPAVVEAEPEPVA